MRPSGYDGDRNAADFSGTGRPDFMTFAVDWALKNNDLSIYLWHCLTLICLVLLSSHALYCVQLVSDFILVKNPKVTLCG